MMERGSETLVPEALARRCADLQQLVDAIPGLVFSKNVENWLVYANRAAVEACAADSVDAMVGTGLRAWLGDDGGALDDADGRALRSGQSDVGSIEHVELPGRGPCSFEAARLPQRDAAGNVTGLVVFLREERRHLDARLLQAQKLESIGKLAGGVAHDFNNLLTTFFGLIAAAQRALPTDSLAHEYLALMQLAAEGGASFTRQLLAFARRQNIEPRVVDLNGLVRQTAALLSRVLGPTVTIALELATEGVPVRVDPSQISQLLMNLALNARDAISETGGRLTFQTSQVELGPKERGSMPPSESGRYAKLVVEDNGEGLSPEAREHLFEPFFTSKALGQGTGLGLATCYGIVKQSNGHIGVESERGQGTRFTIHLPGANAPLEQRAPNRGLVGPVRAGHETVLFAEDDDLVRYLSVAALSSSGYRLIEAAHGGEALKAIEEHAGPIHLLVTDIIMPGLGGIELAHRFRQLRPGAAVLFITGYAGDAYVPIANDKELLRKPFTSDELLLRVRAVLDALPKDFEGTRGRLAAARG